MAKVRMKKSDSFRKELKNLRPTEGATRTPSKTKIGETRKAREKIIEKLKEKKRRLKPRRA